MVPQVRQGLQRPAQVGRNRRQGRPVRDLAGRGPRVRRAAAAAFAAEYGTKRPTAAAKITDDLEGLLTFDDHPAEHWVHLRTTNLSESTFATVRLRQRVTKGACSRPTGIATQFKLIETAQARWRAVNAPRLVALVRAGASQVRDRQTRRTTRRLAGRTPRLVTRRCTGLDYSSGYVSDSGTSLSFQVAVDRSARRERKPREVHQMTTTSRIPAIPIEPAGIEDVHGPSGPHDPLRTPSASTSPSPARAAPTHHHRPRVRRCFI